MELCIDSTRYREETYSNSVELVSGTTGAKLSENNTNILIVIYLDLLKTFQNYILMTIV